MTQAGPQGGPQKNIFFFWHLWVQIELFLTKCMVGTFNTDIKTNVEYNSFKSMLYRMTVLDRVDPNVSRIFTFRPIRIPSRDMTFIRMDSAGAR